MQFYPGNSLQSPSFEYYPMYVCFCEKCKNIHILGIVYIFFLTHLSFFKTLLLSNVLMKNLRGIFQFSPSWFFFIWGFLTPPLYHFIFCAVFLEAVGLHYTSFFSTKTDSSAFGAPESPWDIYQSIVWDVNSTLNSVPQHSYKT